MHAFRLLLVSLMAALISAGLIGCAVFSASAHADADMPGKAQVNHAHHGHDMAGSDHAMPDEGGHQHESCDGCENGLLNRAAISPEAGLATVSIPAPIFIIPAAIALDPAPAAPLLRDRWPPGSGPPSRPNTLTHQKISLLI